jgi:hypothetical protein
MTLPAGANQPIKNALRAAIVDRAHHANAGRPDMKGSPFTPVPKEAKLP